MSNNPLTNVFSRTKTSRLTSKAPSTIQKKTKVNNILTKMFVYIVGKKENNKYVEYNR